MRRWLSEADRLKYRAAQHRLAKEWRLATRDRNRIPVDRVRDEWEARVLIDDFMRWLNGRMPSQVIAQAKQDRSAYPLQLFARGRVKRRPLMWRRKGENDAE